MPDQIAENPRFHEYVDLLDAPTLKATEVTFGFLTFPWGFDTARIQVRPLSDFSQRRDCFSSLLKDVKGQKVFYPPMVHTRSEARDGTWQIVPNTDVPADLWSPPISHLLDVSRLPDQDPHSGAATLIVRLLGFLAGQRTSFHDWDFDTRLVVNPSDRGFEVFPNHIGRIAERALDAWLPLNDREQSAILNALYLHSRARHVYWDWERFMHEHMVLDSMRWLVAQQHPGKWKDRASVKAVCAQFGIDYDHDRVNRIMDHRHSLVHEGLWGGATPGFKMTADIWNDVRDLGHLIQRMIAGALGFASSFRASSWQDRMTHFLQDD